MVAPLVSNIVKGGFKPQTGRVGIDQRNPIYMTGPSGGQVSSMSGGQPMGTQALIPRSDGSFYTDGLRNRVMQPDGRMTDMPIMRTTMAQPTATATQQTPLYGLAGSEQALQQALQGSTAAFQTGRDDALNTLQDVALLGGRAINQGTRTALNALTGNLGIGGFSGGSSGGGGVGASAGRIAGDAGQNLFREASDMSSQFIDAGRQAQQQQLALSGALGQEAFDQAMVNNPGFDFLKQEALDAVMNQATATGGFGGGNVLRALQERGAGLAQQDLQNQFNRAAMLSGQGLQAAGQAGQFLGQAGRTAADIAMNQAGLDTQASIANANNATQQSIAAQGNALRRAGMIADIAQGGGFNVANLLSGLGSQGAGYQFDTGGNIANQIANTGAMMSQGRTRAGEQIAGNVYQTGVGLGNLQNQQGMNLANLLGGNVGAIADLYSQAGVRDAGANFNLAQLLSNLATGQGGQLANIQQNTGAAAAAGRTGQANAIMGGIGNLMGIGAQAGWFNNSGGAGGM